MGYTNYWNHEGFTQEQFNLIIRDLNKILKDDNFSKIKLDNPVISEDEIILNGVGELSYETFFLSLLPTDFDFCKTARKPYDKIVQAVLLIAKKHNHNFDYRSDGDFEDWEDTVLTLKRIFKEED